MDLPVADNDERRLRVDSGRLARNQFDRCAMPMSACELSIASEQWSIECLCERDIRAVICAQRVAQFPHSCEQRLMRVAFDDEPHQIFERLFGAFARDLFSLEQATKDLSHFNIEQMGCVHALGFIEGPRHDEGRSMRLEEHFEQRGGVDNDQRLSRSARTRSPGALLPR